MFRRGRERIRGTNKTIRRVDDSWYGQRDWRDHPHLYHETGWHYNEEQRGVFARTVDKHCFQGQAKVLTNLVLMYVLDDGRSTNLCRIMTFLLHENVPEEEKKDTCEPVNTHLSTHDPDTERVPEWPLPDVLRDMPPSVLNLIDEYADDDGMVRDHSWRAWCPVDINPFQIDLWKISREFIKVRAGKGSSLEKRHGCELNAPYHIKSRHRGVSAGPRQAYKNGRKALKKTRGRAQREKYKMRNAIAQPDFDVRSFRKRVAPSKRPFRYHWES